MKMENFIHLMFESTSRQTSFIDYYLKMFQYFFLAGSQSGLNADTFNISKQKCVIRKLEKPNKEGFSPAPSAKW